MIEYDDAQASLVFDGFTRFGPLDETYVAGTRGTLHSTGPDLGVQKVTLCTRRGEASPRLKGAGSPTGSAARWANCCGRSRRGGSRRNSARDNLQSLALCFAACRSAETGKPQTPGKVRSIASA